MSTQVLGKVVRVQDLWFWALWVGTPIWTTARMISAVDAA